MTAQEGSEAQNVLRDERVQHEEDQRQSKTVDAKQETQDSDGWWSSLSNTDSAPTPTVASFHRVENVKELGEGFISLMDDPALSATPNVTTSSRQELESRFDDEADDLGLGNSVHRRIQDVPEKMTEANPPTEPVQDTAKADEKRGKLYVTCFVVILIVFNPARPSPASSCLGGFVVKPVMEAVRHSGTSQSQPW